MTEMVTIRANGQAIVGAYPCPEGMQPDYVQGEYFVIDGETKARPSGYRKFRLDVDHQRPATPPELTATAEELAAQGKGWCPATARMNCRKCDCSPSHSRPACRATMRRACRPRAGGDRIVKRIRSIAGSFTVTCPVEPGMHPWFTKIRDGMAIYEFGVFQHRVPDALAAQLIAEGRAEIVPVMPKAKRLSQAA